MKKIDQSKNITNTSINKDKSLNKHPNQSIDDEIVINISNINDIPFDDHVYYSSNVSTTNQLKDSLLI